MAGLFLEVKDFIGQNDTLNYINYQSISQEHREFLRSDVWDFHWTQPPAAVYFPGNDFLKTRLQAVNPQFPTQMGQMSAVIRQIQINQATKSGTSSGTFTLDFMDFEDQAIKMWLWDWEDKCGSNEERYSFRKEDVIAEARITVMNSSRKPIMAYEVLGIQLMDPGTLMNPMLSSDDAQNVGQVSATFMFEHWRPLAKNI